MDALKMQRVISKIIPTFPELTDAAVEAIQVTMELSDRNRSEVRKKLLLHLGAKAVMAAEMDVAVMADDEVTTRLLEMPSDRLEITSNPI